MDKQEPELNRGTPANETPPAAAEGRSLPWLARNGPYLVLFAGLIGYLQYKGWDLEDYWNLIKVFLGLGLVIFIHELGHFLVAKWCDVHVETFSIGFGPPLPGCCWQWGETTYMIALFPLGGYVKMVGEGAESDESDTDPRSFKNKSVGKRMSIISAGVTMNVILAFACFVFVFMAHGAERQPGIVDRVDPGAPAWKKGVQSGNSIHQIGNEGPEPYFDQLQEAVMLSSAGQKLKLWYSPPETPEAQWTRTEIEPRIDKQFNDKRPIIGLGPPDCLKLHPASVHKRHELPVAYGSPASRAKPPFEFDDRIIGTTDPDHQDQVTELRKDPRDPEGKKYDYFEFRRRMRQLAGKPAVVRVLRHEGLPDEHQVNITVEPAYHYTLGLRMRMGEIVGIRDDSPAAKADIHEGDTIEWVEVTGPDGRTIRYLGSSTDPQPENVLVKDLDPVRLPFDLEQWAASFPPGKPEASRTVTLRIRGSKPNKDHELAKITCKLDWDDRWRFSREFPILLSSPLSISELGIAYWVRTTVADVRPGSPAEKAGILKDDVIKAIRFRSSGAKVADEAKPQKWEDLEPYQWASVENSFQGNYDKEVDLRLERDKLEVKLTAEEEKPGTTSREGWPIEDRGLIFIFDTRLYKANNLGEAVMMGVHKTTNFIVQVFGHLRALATGRISVRSMIGPIGIGAIAFSVAGDNIFQFIIFLGIISVNLAVINFFPIPVLDGGHMVFLTYEKLRGKPAPEPVRAVATYAGLAFLVCLMGFVLYLDLSRWL